MGCTLCQTRTCHIHILVEPHQHPCGLCVNMKSCVSCQHGCVIDGLLATLWRSFCLWPIEWSLSLEHSEGILGPAPSQKFLLTKSVSLQQKHDSKTTYDLTGMAAGHVVTSRSGHLCVQYCHQASAPAVLTGLVRSCSSYLLSIYCSAEESQRKPVMPCVHHFPNLTGLLSHLHCSLVLPAVQIPLVSGAKETLFELVN